MPTVALLLWCFFLADILYHMSGAMVFLYVQLDFTISEDYEEGKHENHDNAFS